MELKDLIQQTLNELEEMPDTEEIGDFSKKSDDSVKNAPSHQRVSLQIDPRFLEILREKTLVLFEGLQSSQTKDLSHKLDLVINFLEYQLSLIDEALENQAL